MCLRDFICSFSIISSDVRLNFTHKTIRWVWLWGRPGFWHSVKLNEENDYSQHICSISLHFLLITTSLLSETGLRKQTGDSFLLFSCMMTISQDIFNICITYIVYEVRRKGIIYSTTYFFSLFTPCLGIKSQSNKSRKTFFCQSVQ